MQCTVIQCTVLSSALVRPTTTQPQALLSLLYVTVCNATHILDTLNFLVGQLFVFNFAADNHSGKKLTFFYQNTFPGFLEVFVP